MNYNLNAKYANCKDFLLQIRDYFTQNGETIHKARNELKIISCNGMYVVVKSFRVPNIINQVVYAHFRGSKAKKSFENGMRLFELGINSPEPIGYIEFYHGGLLKESFFVSIYQPYDFLIREPLYNNNFENRETIIRQFTSFTYSLHKQNIYHNDYSAGNTLVEDKKNGNYSFSIVDINRMEFHKISIEMAMKNFNKLWANEETLILIAQEYARLSGASESDCVRLILQYDFRLKKFVERRRALKAFVKGMK